MGGQPGAFTNIGMAAAYAAPGAGGMACECCRYGTVNSGGGGGGGGCGGGSGGSGTPKVCNSRQKSNGHIF